MYELKLALRTEGITLEPELKKTCLAAKHEALGARMVPFAGWLMPVQYRGIIEEHLHTRAQAGLFDTCHMGEFYVRGAGAESFIEGLVTCRVASLVDGQARYGLMLNERGGVLDDLIIFRISGEEFMICVNAGTLESDRDWIEAHLPGAGVEFKDESAATAKLDLQGPQADAVLAKVAGGPAIATLRRFRHCAATMDGVPVRISRTGYTGENGYELFFPVAAAGRIWDRLLSYPQVKPIGLGARDTLRLEKGLPLYGHELDEEHTPLEAGLERFVDFEKDFIWKDALLEQKRAGVRRRLVGFVCEGRRAAREGWEVRAGGRVAGRVTSGAFSPCLTQAVGLGYVEAEAAEGAKEGAAITLSDGKVEVKGEIRKAPFC